MFARLSFLLKNYLFFPSSIFLFLKALPFTKLIVNFFIHSQKWPLANKLNQIMKMSFIFQRRDYEVLHFNSNSKGDHVVRGDFKGKRKFSVHFFNTNCVQGICRCCSPRRRRRRPSLQRGRPSVCALNSSSRMKLLDGIWRKVFKQRGEFNLIFIQF
jgi:hypothetical protein